MPLFWSMLLRYRIYPLTIEMTLSRSHAGAVHGSHISHSHQTIRSESTIALVQTSTFRSQTCKKRWLQDLKVEREAREVHEGLHFMHRPSAAASKDPSNAWQTDLGRLSGGERTLVSLALILAVCSIPESVLFAQWFSSVFCESLLCGEYPPLLTTLWHYIYGRYSIT